MAHELIVLGAAFLLAALLARAGARFGLPTIPLFMGLVWVAFDKRKQGWHDKLAGTVVVRKRK